MYRDVVSDCCDYVNSDPALFRSVDLVWGKGVLTMPSVN